MMTCQEAGPLMEKEEFEKLPFMKRWGLKLHLFICKCCKGYKKDSHHIHEIVKSAGAKQADTALSEQDKAEMKSKILTD